MKTRLLQTLLLLVSAAIGTAALAAGGVVKSPTGIAPDRYVYYPGTEELEKDEIRLIACGTGMPAARRDHPLHPGDSRGRRRGELYPGVRGLEGGGRG